MAKARFRNNFEQSPLILNIFRNYFGLFAGLNCLFMGMQFLYFLTISNVFLHALPLPGFVYLEIFGEAILQTVLYLLLSLIQLSWLWGIAARNQKLNTQKPTRLRHWQLLIFFNSIIFLLTINCIFFPLSAFSHLFLPATPIYIIKILLLISGFFLASLTLNTLTCFKLKKITWGLIGTALTFFLVIGQLPTPPTRFSGHTPPNIIIIGIDSLSPERVNKKDMPTLAGFLHDSVHFSETISPLARTYPAWTSILTGLYPIHHHARENLMPYPLVRSDASIIWRLRELGYSTIFASDDRRFNNLDKDFGFQTIVGPKVGVNDVLLGGFYDFPLSNLLINFKISRWILPYHYMNRASNYAYYPKTFDNEIESALNKTSSSSPLLLAVHYTLPHWPYSWAVSTPEQAGDEFNIKETEKLYTSAVKKVDQQVSLLLHNLKQQGLLTNSLIFVLSDHGEALYKKGSRITSLKKYQGVKPSPLAHYFKQKTTTSLEKSAGHGSDLLSPTQFHCVLGVKIFNDNKVITTAKTINTRVALIDIAPTIYAFLNLPSPREKRHFDGISLLPSILGTGTPPTKRTFMLESGLLPNQFISRPKAIAYAKILYYVNQDNDRLELQEQNLNKINAMKLYGVLENDWLLVLYPNGSHYLTVVMQLSSQQWSDQRNSAFAAKSPLKKLLKELRTFYRFDLENYPATRSQT